MFTRIRRNLSVSNVLAAFALFLALGGTAMALSANSVKSRHIVDGQVRGKDIKDGGVKPKDVKLKCPAGQTLVRGLCFDTDPRGPATSVYAASDECRQAGGWLPDVLALRSVRNAIDLGAPGDERFADSRFNNGGARTIVVRGNGGTIEAATGDNHRFNCVYSPLSG